MSWSKPCKVYICCTLQLSFMWRFRASTDQTILLAPWVVSQRALGAEMCSWLEL